MDTLNPFSEGYVEPEEVEAPAYEELRPKPFKSGIQRIPSAEYHADPAPEASLSATLGKIVLAKTPLHAWYASPRLNPGWEPTVKKTFDLGRAAHRATLGFGDDYVSVPTELLAKNGAVSTTAAKDFVAQTRESGRTPLSADEVKQVEAMRIVAHARLAERGIALNPDRSELSAVVQIDGVWCRAMFDNVEEAARLPIYDFKTCEDASPQACLRAITNYGYDLQEGHYRAVWKAVTGEDRPFVFIFQEKSEPYEVTLVSLSGQFRAMADRRAAKARKIWGECIRSGEWPGYPAGMHEVDAPAWLIEREFQEDF